MTARPAAAPIASPAIPLSSSTPMDASSAPASSSKREHQRPEFASSISIRINLRACGEYEVYEARSERRFRKTERNILGRNQVAMTKGALYSLFLVLVLIATAVGKERYSCPAAIHTLYSRNAISLNSASQHTVRLISPDGKKTLLARTVEDPKNQDELQIRYTVKFAGKTFQTKLVGFNGEVAWSTDSHAFAVTQTEGGGGLGSRVYVFYVDETGLRKPGGAFPLEDDFGNPVKCEVAW